LQQTEAHADEAVPVTPAAHNAAASSSLTSSASAAAASATAAAGAGAAAATNPEQSASDSSVNTPAASRCQCAFSITKLASSGIIMLQLHQQASQETIRYTSEHNHAQHQVAEQQDDLEALPANRSRLDSLPVTVVHQILDALQAGTLATPE